MTDDAFAEQFGEILARIDTLPESRRGPLLELAEATRRRHQQIRASMRLARAALDDWRLLHKYRLFDREARLRETRDQGSQPESDTES